MFKNLFSQKEKAIKKKGGRVSFPATPTYWEMEAADEEFQILSLHRRAFDMTPELERRRVEERLRKEYQLTPFKSGIYL